MVQAVYSGSTGDLRQLIGRLPIVVGGSGSDINGIREAVQKAVGLRLEALVKQNFLVMSRGGTGAGGIKWPPLKRSTIAGRRPPSHKKRGERPMGLLTAAQDKRWRQLYGRRLGMLLAKHGAAAGDAKARAAAYAWTILKGEGAKTRLATLGGRTVQMLMDTGDLFAGMTFGVQDGKVLAVATKKTWHHKGVPGKLPARPFWPEPLPDAWMTALGETAQKTLAVGIQSIIQRGVRA